MIVEVVLYSLTEMYPVRILDDIEVFMKGTCSKGYLNRLVHHKDHEDSLYELNGQLDDLLKSFMARSPLFLVDTI